MFKKRILWHLPYAMIGGVETLYRIILKYLDTEKYENFVTCRIGIQEWVNNQYGAVATVSTFSDQNDLAQAISKVDPDVIMGTHGMTLYSALDICAQDYPVVEIVHGSHIWAEHNVHMPKHFTKHVVCVSKNAEEVYLENSNFGIPTSVILNGVDTDTFFPRKEPQKTVRNFAYFGRFLECDKHLTKMIQAFRSLGTQHANLYLIGGSPQEILHLKKFAQKLKLGNSVKFFGHTPNPETFYKEIDIVTVRSEAEGYCNVVAEAMASGVPVVAYNFGGILRHLEPGTALVAHTQREYALHLNQVFRNHNLRIDMILKGFKFIKTKGNARAMALAYENIFEKVLAGEPTTVKAKAVSKLDMPFVGKVSVVGSRPVVGVANPHWHGIHTATRNCCDIVVNWHASPAVLMKSIIRHDPRHILFSGGCPGFIETAKKIRNRHPQYPISVFYHAGVSHFSFSGGMYGKGERDALLKMINAQKAGIYSKIAVAAPGLAEVGRKAGIRMEFTGNVFKMNTIEYTKEVSSTINIGNFNRHHDHKHTSAGLGAMMLLPKSKIHMLSCQYKLPFIDYSRVQSYNDMPQEALYKLYQQMDVCLQMSFIETFNISVLEMWAHGVPVVVGSGNYELVRSNDDLKYFCLVEDQTNPIEVAAKIRLCVENRDRVVQAQYAQLEFLNAGTVARWKRFFE